MFVFEREQYIHTIGGVRIGGVSGETPTVLAGTIFYSGDKTVTDSKRGAFDKKAAEDLIHRQDEQSALTGNPCMVQVFAESTPAMLGYLGFVADMSSAPILIDSTEAAVRLAGLRYAEESGFLDRAIYNSLNISATQDELNMLAELRPTSAIVLAFNPRDSTIAGRRAVLEQPQLGRAGGLLATANELGISKPLIDTATTAMGAGAGSSVSFVMVAKTVYGQPTGSGIHNAPASWAWLRKLKKTNRAAYEACDISSGLLIQSMGANFILYGPIANSDRVFPVIAMADVFAAESLRDEFGVEPAENHPFHKLL